MNVHLSKLDVAKRELDHSIKLFLMRGDFVIIHHSAGAAYDILRYLAKTQGITSLYDEIDKIVKPEKRREIKDRMRKAQNFFKHVNNDSKEEQLEFNPEQSTHILIDAIGLYQSLTTEITPLMLAYRSWYYTKNSDLLLDDDVREKFEDPTLLFNPNDRMSFLEIAQQFEQGKLK